MIALAAAAALTAAQPAPPPASLHGFLQRSFAADAASGADTRYVAASVDLNGDGRNEAVVRLTGSYVCGSGGCPIYVYTPAGASWRQIGHTTITNAPIRALLSRTNGWRDLTVTVAGGGIGRAYEALLPFNGRTYPLNPSIAPARRAPAAAPGTVLIRDEDEARALFD